MTSSLPTAGVQSRRRTVLRQSGEHPLRSTHGWSGTHVPAEGCDVAGAGRPDESGVGGCLSRGPLHQTGLAVGCLVLVDDALGRGLVDPLDGQTQRFHGVFRPFVDSDDRFLRTGTELGADGLVAGLTLHCLSVALDLATDVCHNWSLSCSVLSNRRQLGAPPTGWRSVPGHPMDALWRHTRVAAGHR